MTAPFFSPFFGLVVLLLWAQTAAAVFLIVSPNRQQFFSGEPIRLSCEVEEGGSAAGLTLKRTLMVITETCGIDRSFGKCSGSTYTVSALASADQGIYWCEELSGQKSINVTITVSDRPFILDIPALPVMLGSKVTLRCRDRQGSTTPAHLFKYGTHEKPLTAAPVGELTISDIQQPDEGFYWCSDKSLKSPSSHLTVTAFPPLPIPTSPSAPSYLRLIRHLVVISPYCMSTFLMLSLLCCKKTVKTPAITMEMGQHVEMNEELQHDYINAAVETTEHDF